MKPYRIALGIALAALMIGGQAMADTVVDPLNQNFEGFPTTAYTQQDKTYDNFIDVEGTFLDISNPITNIKSVLFPTYDLHTVTFNGSFLGNAVYDIKYSIEIFDLTSSLFITSVGAGINQSYGGIATLTKTIKDFEGNLLGSFNAITGNVADISISPQKFLWIEDILTTNSAGVNGISNSFVQTVVPEPGTLSLFGLGLVGLAFTRNSVKRGWSALLKR